MKNKNLISRYNPRIQEGLTAQQVKDRKKDKLTNKAKLVVGKSYAEIIFTNVLSFFNITLFLIAGVMIYFKLYFSLFFLFVLIPNTLIGLYQDLKARALMGKLKVMTAPRVTVVRDKKVSQIMSDDVVLDDIIVLKNSCQIPVDGIVLDGNLSVNEALLTGESDNIVKNPGDMVYSGSYVVSGTCYIRADKVGEECYAATLAGKAKKFRRSSSEILKSLKGLFRTITGIVIAMAIFMGITFFVQKREFNADLVSSISGSMVSMIPSGLYLLTSIALTLAVMSLGKKQAQVQDFYAVEMLARVDLLCVDKTGTITDGSMMVQSVVPLSTFEESETAQMVTNLIHATKDDNYTAEALKKYFKNTPDKSCTKALPFNSDNKYSAATFARDKTYVLGAIEKLNINDKNKYIEMAKEYAVKGLRVLLFGYSDDSIQDNKFEGLVRPICFIILEDHVREDAIKTFEWLQASKVGIKVISGDNAQAVSTIAKSAHIKDADKFVSLDGKTLDETYECAMRYTVFGRVSPEQKEVLVKAFKNQGRTVGMTGDGVNDILALKRADCSIAVASGADAARNVSHIVLLDNDFSHLPEVIAEGRRVVNNLQRTSSVFLVKTIFSMVLTFIFTLLSLVTKNSSISYPFATNNMYPWEIISIGIAAFFLALEPNNERLKGNFLNNIFKKAFPAACMMIASVLIIFGLYWLQNLNGFDCQIKSFETATSIACLSFNALSLVVLFKVCSPFNRFRRRVMIGISVMVFAVLLYSCVMTYMGYYEYSILNIKYYDLKVLTYIIILVNIVVCAGFFLGGYKIKDSIKERISKKNASKEK